MTDHRPLPGQSPNMVAAMSEIASKQDLVDATSGVTEDIGNIYDELDGFGDTIGQAAADAENARLQAQQAYDLSSHREKEFAVTSSGLIQGSNEQPLGALIVFPPGSACKLERLIFTSKTNTASQVTVQLIRRTIAGVETIAHTTVITGGLVTFPDSTISYAAADLDHYYCNIPVGGIVGGSVTALHCCIEYFIYDPTP